MTISEKDFFLALLSMDSYNRGYSPGINLGSSNSLGSATVSDDRFLPAGSEVAGFYAAAYDTPWGTVISYWGTDNPDFIRQNPATSDFWTGWVTGFGVVVDGGQAELAARFYNEVTRAAGGNVFAGISGNVILTGHSLGGALAGFTGALFGNQVVALS